jgi:hypothetical protein
VSSRLSPRRPKAFRFQPNPWLLTTVSPHSLAYAEMHLILANLFRRFEVQPTPNIDKDMVWVDRVIVHSTRNLRIKVKSKDDARA